MHPPHKHVSMDDAAFAAPHEAEPEGHTRTTLPIISAEVLGPEEINVGSVASYAVLVANLGEAVVDRVHVNVHLPPTAEPVQMHPRPVSREGTSVRFEIGRLTPKTRQRIQIELLAKQRGPMDLRAEAVFTAVASVATKVCLPELAMSVSGPEAVVIGDAATFKVVIENRGDGPAEEVTIAQADGDGPQAMTGAAHVGRLAPGEAREIYLSAMADRAGRFAARFIARAWGGLETRAQTVLLVAQPMLAMEASGPRVCAVQSPEVFTLTVANPGDAPASNVEAVAAIPAGLHVIAFDRPVQFEASRRIVRWRLPSLLPGARETLRLKAAALHADRFVLQTAAAADHNLRAEAEHLCEAAQSYSRRVA
jgi:hypothetical protein